MPRYKGQLVSEEGEDTPTDDPILHLFEYSQGPQNNRTTYRKDIVALESCIFVNRRSLAKRRDRRKDQQKQQDEGGEQKEQQEEPDQQKQQEEQDQQKHQEEPDQQKQQEEPDQQKHQEEQDQQKHQEEPDQQKQQEEQDFSLGLEVGQEFDGYVIKCPNGPYDYALKLWNIGRVAPLDSGYPRQDEEIPGVIIDRNGEYLTIACGSNIAYATKKSFLHAGVNPDDLSLPFGRLKVSLTKAETRPPEVSVAAWVATPTQVHPKKN